MKNKILIAALFLTGMYMLSGCSIIQKAKKADTLERQLADLKQRMKLLEQEKEKEAARIAETAEQELSDLEKAKAELEESLRKEINEYKAKLEMTERGLVITFVSEVFFDSGKDKVKQTGEDALVRVAEVLNKEVVNSPIAIEGHTDNEPIKYSGWRSNWELSSARSLAVLHYLIESCSINPERLSANGYGQYQPVAPNDSIENKQKNRRVEIVILPAKISKVKAK